MWDIRTLLSTTGATSFPSAPPLVIRGERCSREGITSEEQLLRLVDEITLDDDEREAVTAEEDQDCRGVTLHAPPRSEHFHQTMIPIVILESDGFSYYETEETEQDLEVAHDVSLPLLTPPPFCSDDKCDVHVDTCATAEQARNGYMINDNNDDVCFVPETPYDDHGKEEVSGES